MAETAEKRPEEVKPGAQTSEFYVTAAAMLAPYAVKALPPTWQVALSTAAAILYGIGRVLIKLRAARR